MLGSREDARDATQEAFLRAYKYLGRFDESQSFAAWLYKIVINVCRDISRKRGAPGRVTSFEEERDLGNLEYLASGDDVEASAIVSQQQRLVALALETLPAKERAAIVLRDLEGLSTREVARILGSSQATVRAQICSARLKIRQFHEKVLRRKGTQ
jgi:RNA polymerase sigma-70 factor (ECF subfamily)